MATLVTDEMVKAAIFILIDKAEGCPRLNPNSKICIDATCACRDVMRAALEAIAPMIRDAALEALAARVEEMAGWEDTNTRDPLALMQVLGRQDMAYEIVDVARAMKTTHGAPNA